MNLFLEYSFEKNLKSALMSSVELRADFKKSYFIFRCPYCGDSKKSKYKKRAYILKQKQPWVFYCHNCNRSSTAENFLKEKFPVNYREYIKDLIEIKNENKNIVYYNKDNLNRNKEEKEEKIIFDDDENIKHFKKITSSSDYIFKRAIKYCKSRKIDENIWKTFYVALDGFYKDRLIIPFYNEKKEIYYWVGRSLDENRFPKYLNRVKDKTDGIYNYYVVDKEKPVIILEGVVDSFFVENSISILGTHIKDEIKEKIKTLDKKFIFDNDDAGKKQSIKSLLTGEYVFNWKLFLKEKYIVDDIKDINDLYVKKYFKENLKYEDLKRYFTNNIYDKVYFL